MKPVISYYGGKQRLASKIIPYIPKHTVYCEPFCGGASILFMKPCPKVTNTSCYREVINDTNGNLINFYKQLRDNGEALSEKIKLTLCSEEEHKLSKCFDNIDDIERARRYYVNIQQSFSNQLNCGWRRSVFGRNHAAVWKNKISKIEEYIDRMADVNISNTDALKCILQWDSPQTFFYIDPPYPGANQGHYNGYKQSNFDTLVGVLKSIKGSFILSCYAQSDLPVEWERKEFIVYCSASGEGKVKINRSIKSTELGDIKRTEVIWIKKSTEPRAEIKKLYATGNYDCFTGE